MTPPFLANDSGNGRTKQNDFELETLPHMESLRKFALQRTGNVDDANDLLQETVMRAFRFWDKYEKGTNVRAWLFQIMRNTHINQFRKDSREPAKFHYEEIGDAQYLKPLGSQSPAESRNGLYSNLIGDEVATALEQLGNEYRTVVILCDIEGMSYEETAEFVECPLGTVRSRLHRARKQLKGKLLEYAADLGYADRGVQSN